MQRNNSSAWSPPARGWEAHVERVLAATWARPFGAITRRRLVHYLEEVTRWGQKVDLTAARSPNELVDLSLADAGVLGRLEVSLGSSTDEWLDVGTGGGAPGIPLLILLAGERGDDVRARLIEPREKRTAFLRSVVGGLGLPGVSVERARSDQLLGASCDVAVARATLPPPEWLREGARLARQRVWLLLAREAAPSSTEGLTELADESYTWPLTGVQRRAVGFRRVEAPRLPP